jgi:peptidoglycan/xylan/chitin deacetylase (PgdA/CDA1 family)
MEGILTDAKLLLLFNTSLPHYLLKEGTSLKSGKTLMFASGTPVTAYIKSEEDKVTGYILGEGEYRVQIAVESAPKMVQFAEDEVDFAYKDGLLSFIASGSGALLVAKKAFPLKVISTSPKDKQTHVSVKTEVRVKFNMELDEGMINAEVFQLLSEGESVTGRLFYEPKEREVTFIPTSPLKYNTLYTFKVKDTLKSKLGVKLKEEFTLSFSTHSRDYLPPSQNPPGGLLPKQCPQFVTLIFDDCFSVEGMDYFREMLRKHGIKGTFLVVGDHLRDEKMRGAIKALADEGHKIGNHTLSHAGGLSYQDWKKEMEGCNQLINQHLGIKEVHGFRAPYLHYNDDMLKAVKECGLLFDCSLPEGHQLDIYGTNHYWPYTLDHGSPCLDWLKRKYPHSPPYPWVGKHEGVWELPVYALMLPDKMQQKYGIERFKDALDWNLWGTFASPEDFLLLLKHNLDLRYNGNRCPFILGLHPSLYATQDATTAAKRKAIEDFIIYAKSLDDVRFVTAEELIEWLKDPKPLREKAFGTLSVSVKAADARILESVKVKILERKEVARVQKDGKVLMQLVPGAYTIQVLAPMHLTGNTKEGEVLIKEGEVTYLQIEMVAGDINADGTVDIQDIVLVASSFGKKVKEADINADGIVDIQDIVLCAKNFGKTSKDVKYILKK